MKLFIFTITFAFCFVASAQQGRNFSMWYQNNYQHNPAAVGTNDLDLKVFANYRMQYFTVASKPFSSFSVSGELKLLKSRNSKNHLGIGASIINDQSGDGRYMVNDINIPIAYHIYFDDDNSISLGVAPGLYNRTIGQGNFTWESDWNGYRFDESGITVPPVSTMNFDVGAGLMFQHKTSATNKFYFGASARHLTQPDISFGLGDDRLAMRFIGQFGMKHRFDRTYFGISPNVIAVFQGANRNIIAGTNFDFYLQDPSLKTIFLTPTYFSVGAYYRYLEGIILNFQFSFKQINIALSYDSNINSMTPASKSVGAFELAVSYDIMFNKRDKLLY